MSENTEPAEPQELYNTENALPEITPIEELEAQAEAGTLPEPERTLGDALAEASGPIIEDALDAVVEAAAAESEESGVGAEGAVPLSQVLPEEAVEAEVEAEAPAPSSTEHAPRRNINFKLVGTRVSEEDAKADVAALPEGSFYKKNPLDPRPCFRVYKAV